MAKFSDVHDADDHSGVTGLVADAANVTFTPAGTIAATNVQDAIEEVATEAGTGSGGGLLPLIGDPPSFAGSADRDFRGAADLGPYTAVGSDGASTIALRTTTTTINIYQLTAAGLLIQCGHAETQEFRADYTLPDLQSIIVAISGAPNVMAGDNAYIGLRLNDNDSAASSGNWIGVGLEQDTTEWVIQGNSSIDSAGREMTLVDMTPPPLLLFRIARDGLVYRSWVSVNGGATWVFVDTDTFGGALSNIWISVVGNSSGQVHMMTVRVPFIVEGAGDDAYDPW